MPMLRCVEVMSTASCFARTPGGPSTNTLSSCSVWFQEYMVRP